MPLPVLPGTSGTVQAPALRGAQPISSRDRAYNADQNPNSEPPPLSALARGAMSWCCPSARPCTVTGTPSPARSGAWRVTADAPSSWSSHVIVELDDELDEALTLVAEASDGEILVARDLLRVTAQ